ncbi:MAG: polysaccharide deacetylase family protein [Bacteroidota bacterium]
MIRVFLFHRVSDVRESFWDPMDPALFKKCIQKITKKYHTILLEDFIADPAAFKDSKNLAAITFDDGYKDNILNAAPILKEYNCPASFYITTECIELNKPTWTHKIELLFQGTVKRKATLNDKMLPDGLRNIFWDSGLLRMEIANKMTAFLMRIPHVDRSRIIKQLMKEFNDVAVPSYMMNWNDLNELKNAGHYIGSHGVTHSMLGAIEDEHEIAWELNLSKQIISEKTGTDPITFCYPVGSYDERVLKLMKESGYKAGLIVNAKNFYSEKMSFYQIPRVELYNEGWLKTRLRINGVIEKIKTITNYHAWV